MKKRFLATLLCLCMVVTLLPTVTFAATGSSIQLGTSGVADKDFVYFGNYNSADIKWKVLDADADNTGETNAMFLLSEYLLVQNNVPFDANSNVWQGSNAQVWCTAFAESAAFTISEKSALKSVKKNDGQTTQYGQSWGTSSLVNEKVFYLSAEEAAKYIGPNDRAEGLATTTSGSAAGGWWLRSPYHIGSNLAGFVNVDGSVGTHGVAHTSPGVRPAFNLNLNSVLFSSAAVGGKSSGTVGAAALNSNLTPSGTTAWKLTLLDNAASSGRENFDVSTTAVSTTTAGGDVSIEYSGAKAGISTAPEYLSAMLVDGSNNVLYYGRLKSIAASGDAAGTQDITIPALSAGTYTLKIFNEQYNGNYKTDYSSAMKDVTLTITAPVTYAITYDANGGSGTMANGTATDGTAFTLPSCTFTAPTGQQFKEWAIGSATGTKVNAGDTHIFTAATTVYAVWEPVPATTYTITLSANPTEGGTASVSPTSGKAGDTITVTATPNNGYKLKNILVDGVAITGNTFVMKDANATVTAVFEKVAVPTEPSKDTTSPQTGDNSNMILWVALLFISGGAVITLTVFTKRKKHQAR